MPKSGCTPCKNKKQDSLWLKIQTTSSVVCQSWPDNNFLGVFSRTARSCYQSWRLLQTLQFDC